MTTPSSANAKFRSEKAVVADAALRPFDESSSGRADVSQCSRRLFTVTPAGSASNDDNVGDRRPLTTTTSAAASARNDSTASASRGIAAARARSNDMPAIGATFVNRHSSSRVVGNPRSRNLANAPSRPGRGHSGPASGARQNASKLETYDS